MSFDVLLPMMLQRILPPNSLLGWLIWIVWLALLALFVRGQLAALHQWRRAEWGRFLLLALATQLAALLLVLHFPAEYVLPIPGSGAPAQGVLLPLLAALPWMLAAARWGRLPGAVLGALSGLMVALLDTRSPYNVLEYATLGALFGALLHQSYRSRFFASLRQPLSAALLLALLFPLLYVGDALFWAGASQAASLDFALSRLPWVALALALQLFIGALFLRFAQRRLPDLLPRVEARDASPAERSLEGRLLFALGPVVALLFIALASLTWFGAGRAASQLQSERIATGVDVAADGVPFLLETGQTLVQQLAADPRLTTGSPGEVRVLLADYLSAVPYFEQFVYLDAAGVSRAGFPVASFDGLKPTQRELDAVALALQGLPLQFFAIPPLDENSTAAQLSFVTAVRDEGGNPAGALVGRTRLNANPFAQPVIQSLDSIADLGGQALLLDGDGRIVYSPTGVSLLADYSGQRGDAPLIYQDTGADGARRQVLYQPATGSAWAVVAQVPAILAQQLALSIVWPVLLVLLLLALVAYGLLRLSLRSVTGGLGDLAREAHRIAAGDLDAPLSVRGADEVARLGQAFESMRQRLKQRQDENQRLLNVSQQIAGSLEMRSQIDPILEAALAGGATSARLVFGGAADLESDLVGFGRGELSETYAALDAQVLPMTRTQARVLLTNPARARLQPPAGAPHPTALAAFALNHEGDHLGALWLAYGHAQTFPAESVRYLETLAGQAALAAANARLYLNARIGRQRMEAILAATPDPVLVSDQGDRLLLANPAAMSLLGIEHLPVQGSRVDQVIEAPDLLALLKSGGAATGEVRLRNEQIYHATVTPIEIDGEPMGRACVLRDITQFKQSEEMRSEFLSAVSHDLRDPLERISNALTMLGMVGELNERQESYAEEIANTAQSMDNLVGNLLNLQRVEGGQGLQLQATDILALLHEVRDSLQARARQKQIDIVIEQPVSSLPAATADPALLRQALYNVLDNAIKFSPRGKPVQVGVNSGDGTLLIEITDQGVGIAPVDLPHIFERMYRPSGSAQADGGGMGLAIVKSVVERHRGRVWAESELGAGSRFYVEIPLDSGPSS